jgi:hypothetical protein
MGGGPNSLANLPANIVSQAATVREATLSFNSLTSLEGLEPFGPTLEVLVLDNNSLASVKTLPTKLPKLHTLWLNNNQLNNLNATLDVLAARCPGLQYLSLLRNPCCPHELSGKNEHEYSRYRIYTKHRIPTLTTLDADQITDEEATTAKERGAFYQTVVAPAAVAEADAKNDEEEERDSAQPAAPAAAVASMWAERETERPKEAVYSNQRHFYSGKTSEGNRFIGNDML